MSQIPMRSRSKGTDERQGVTDRRGFLTGAAATLGTTAWAAASVAARAQQPSGGSTTQGRYGPNAEPVRYPEPDVVVLDPRFEKIKIGNSPIRRLHTGML